MKINVPPAPAGKEKIVVRFTYDINGILEVEAKAVSTGEVKSLYIQSSDTNYTQEEMKKMMEGLENIKKDYKEKEEYIYVMELGKRLYEESIGYLRDTVGETLKHLEYILSTQDDFKIRKYIDKCKGFFESIDANNAGITFNQDMLDDFMKEEDDDDEDDLDDFTSRYSDE